MDTIRASRDERIRHLLGVGLFQGLAPGDLAAVADAARRREIRRDGYFFEQDEPASTLYVLCEGRVKLSQLTPEGNQVVLHVVGPGELFGAISVTSGVTYPDTAQAMEDSAALSWDSETLQRLMERMPRLAISALHAVTERTHELQNRYRELATERVERRVAHTLLRLAGQAGRSRPEGGVLIDMPLSRQDLAEMTGTTLYTVSRILSHWEQLGLVAGTREQVVILSSHRLVAIAEDLPADGEP